MPNSRHPYAPSEPPGPGLRCPRCQGPLERIRRHFGDRVLSLVLPVRRYRCDTFACGWEGLKRHRRGREEPAVTPQQRHP